MHITREHLQYASICIKKRLNLIAKIPSSGYFVLYVYVHTLSGHTCTPSPLQCSHPIQHASGVSCEGPWAGTIRGRPDLEAKVSPPTEHHHTRGEETAAVHVSHMPLQTTLQGKKSSIVVCHRVTVIMVTQMLKSAW